MAKSLCSFRRHLKKNADVRVHCPRCMEEMSFDHFYKTHVKERHDLTQYNKCVLCFGQHEWRWNEKGHERNGKHLNECLKSFLKTNRVRPPVVPEPLPRIDYRGLASCLLPRRTRDDRKEERVSEYVGFYDPCFEKPEMWSSSDGMRFHRRTGLGADVSGIVARYLADDMLWFHLMVKHSAFDTFAKKMCKIRDEFVVLPYGCLCDGLKTEEGGRVSHRHLIVACVPESKFESVLRDEVKLPATVGRRAIKAKLCVRIRDALHLAQTIVYVSRPNATCDRGIPDFCEEEGKSLSHYHLFRPLVEQAVAFVCSLIPNGIQKLLTVHNKSKDVVDWVDKVFDARDATLNYKWMIRVGEIGWKFLNHVVLVDKELEPCEEETDLRLYLFDETPRFYKRNPELSEMSDEEWEAYQIEKQNTFRWIRDRPYILSRKQQNMMNQIRRVEKTKDEHWMCRLIENGKTWKSRLETVETERDALKEKVVELEKRLLVSENESLRSELMAVKARLTVVERENDRLKEEIAALRFEEIERLRKDNERLQNRLNVFLQRENVKDPTSDSARFADGD